MVDVPASWSAGREGQCDGAGCPGGSGEYGVWFGGHELLVAGNTGLGATLMPLPLATPGAEAKVIEGVVRAAAENTEFGSQVMNCWSV